MSIQSMEAKDNAKYMALSILKLLYPKIHYQKLCAIPPQYLPAEVQELYEYLHTSATVRLSCQIEYACSSLWLDIQSQIFFNVINRTAFLTDDQRARALCYFNIMQSTGRSPRVEQCPHDCIHPNCKYILQYVNLNCKNQYIEFGCGHKLVEFRCGHTFHSPHSLIHDYFATHVCPQQPGPSTHLSKTGCHYESAMNPCDVFIKVLFPCGHLAYLPCDRLIQFEDGSIAYFYPEPVQDNMSFDAMPISVFVAELMAPSAPNSSVQFFPV